MRRCKLCSVYFEEADDSQEICNTFHDSNLNLSGQVVKAVSSETTFSVEEEKWFKQKVHEFKE